MAPRLVSTCLIISRCSAGSLIGVTVASGERRPWGELGSAADGKHCVIYSPVWEKISGCHDQLTLDQSTQDEAKLRSPIEKQLGATSISSSSCFLLFYLSGFSLSSPPSPSVSAAPLRLSVLILPLLPAVCLLFFFFLAHLLTLPFWGGFHTSSVVLLPQTQDKNQILFPFSSGSFHVHIDLHKPSGKPEKAVVTELSSPDTTERGHIGKRLARNTVQL